MNILIVCATHAECNFLKKLSIEKLEWNTGSFSFQYKNIFVTVLVTGVGMVATTYFLQKAISEKKFNVILNLGIAGSFKKAIALGTVYHVTTDSFAEMGAEDDMQFISAFQLGLQDPDQFPFEDGKLANKNFPKLEQVNRLPTASSITVNRVHGNESSIGKTIRLFNPDLETMEGAAFFYVCALEKISCIQLRAVSNIVEKRNRHAWNIPIALENLEKTTRMLLDELAALNKNDGKQLSDG